MLAQVLATPCYISVLATPTEVSQEKTQALRGGARNIESTAQSESESVSLSPPESSLLEQRQRILGPAWIGWQDIDWREEKRHQCGEVAYWQPWRGKSGLVAGECVSVRGWKQLWESVLWGQMTPSGYPSNVKV